MKLGDVDWAKLSHAGGPADDVPDMILALADEDPEVRASAVDALLELVFEYDEETGKVTLFDCTPHVVPFIAAFVDREVDDEAFEDDQAMLSDVLVHLGAASRDHGHPSALRDAVAAALEHHASWALDGPE
ncbi:MAG: hypothetical protein IPJ34_08810 [Myxococcales bacterium]|nr:hypothetical protein [Myxococcales bacterium]